MWSEEEQKPSKNGNYRWDQVPEQFREPFINTGYRSPRSTVGECIRSVFQISNETVNFWTHILPSIYFSWRMYCFWLEEDLPNNPYMYPYAAYMLSVCIVPFTSAFAHVFNTISDRARHCCFLLDYGAVSLYVIGAAIAYKSYVFPEALMNTTFSEWYLPCMAFFSTSAMLFSSLTRFMPNSKKKKFLRVISFFVPYMFDSIPIIYRFLMCEKEECLEPGVHHIKMQFIFGGIGTFTYATHVPERYFPGAFDLIGHSHQLFHIFTVIGTNDQVTGLLVDSKLRKELLLERVGIPSFGESVGLMIGVATVNVAVLIFFISKVYRTIPQGTSSTNILPSTKLRTPSGQSNNHTMAAGEPNANGTQPTRYDKITESSQIKQRNMTNGNMSQHE